MNRSVLSRASAARRHLARPRPRAQLVHGAHPAGLARPIISSSRALSCSVDISADDVDTLVLKGIRHIMEHGERVRARAGDALQCYYTNYFLRDPRNRVHTLRAGTVKYFAREMLAYFGGSLLVHDGFAQASKFWLGLADEQGKINSNYGYYCFHQQVNGEPGRSQYQWAIDCLLRNPDSRRAIININQPEHKSNTKDFPCTVSLVFYIRKSRLYCDVFSRSTDIITGLPYDMGFFSFLHELVCEHLITLKYPDLKLGYTCMRTTFTQLYDRTADNALRALASKPRPASMPRITDAREVLSDIHQGTSRSEVVRWVHANAQAGDQPDPRADGEGVGA